MLAFNPKPIFWKTARLLMLLGMVGIFYGLAIEVKIANVTVRELFWFVGIPFMVLIIYFVPLFWRNICPLATFHLVNFNFRHRRKLEILGPAANQITDWRKAIYQFLIKKGMVISASLFLLIVPLRLVFITESSHVTLYLLAGIFLAAFITGFIFPVKSGWCTSICPVNAVEKTYAINPMVFIKNQRCDYTFNNQKLTCSGCSFNCIDVVEPEHAYWQQQSNKLFHDSVNPKARKMFLGLLPGFIAAYMVIALLLNIKPWLFPLDPIRKALWIYVLTLTGGLLTYALYMFIKVILYEMALRKEKALSLDKPSIYYVHLKRKLELIYTATALNFFWIGSAWAITFKIVAATGVTNVKTLSLLYVGLVSVVCLLSLMGVKAGWNESFGSGNYRPSWW